MDKNKIFSDLESKGISKTELEAEFNKIFQAQPANSPADRRERAALNILFVRFMNKISEPVYGFEGFFFANSGEYDANEGKMKQAKKAFDTDMRKAVIDGITDEKGHAKDTREKWPDGSPNKNFGKLLKSDLKTTLEAFAVEIDAAGKPITGPKKLIITCRNTKIGNIPLGKWVRFKLPKGNTYDASASESRMFVSKVHGLGMEEIVKPENVYDFVQKLNPGKIYELEDAYQALKTGKIPKDTKCFVIASVRSINDLTSKQNRPIGLSYCSIPATAWVKQHIPVDFAIESSFIFYGRLYLTTRRDSGEEQFNIDAEGLIDVPGLVFRNTPEAVASADDVDPAPEVEPDAEEEPQKQLGW